MPRDRELDAGVPQAVKALARVLEDHGLSRDRAELLAEQTIDDVRVRVTLAVGNLTLQAA